jgi:hypothetical protein
VAALHGVLECAVALVVVTTSERVAKWARRPIATFQPSSPWVPLVVGPGDIPKVTNLETARRSPELAILSALAHGAAETEELEVGLAGFAAADALRSIDEVRAAMYHEIIRRRLPAWVLQALEEQMQIKGFEFTSEFARKHRAEGKAQAVVAVLEGRGLPVSDDERKAIVACRDTERLDRWLAIAGTAASAAEILRRT